MEDLSKHPERLKNITATDMATLFGLNPYETPAKLLEKKTNPQPILNNMHLRRGQLKEPSVLHAFYLDMGMKAVPHEGGTLVSPHSRIAATPDGYVDGTLNVVECKSVTTRNIEKWYESIPTQYHMQVFVQLYVVGTSLGYIGALEEGDPYDCEYRFIAWEVRRDERIDALMEQEVARFWSSFDEGKLFRVNSKTKQKMVDLMKHTTKLIYPTEIPIKKDLSDAEKLSDIISLFK